MSTRQAEPDNPAKADRVESPDAEQMRGANGPAREDSSDRATAAPSHNTNADDTEPGAGDQDIDTAGTEADEQSAAHDAMGFPPSDSASPAKIV
jgi:hypothetical protein